MPTVLRWGRSAYETDAALSLEASSARRLGLSWSLHPSLEPPSPAALAAADVLVVTSKVRVTSAVLDGLGGRVVVTTTSGYEHIDVDAARARGVAVLRSPEARRDAVVEHALAVLLALLRRLPDQQRAAEAGRWARGELPGLGMRGLRGATVLVVGLGVIGSRMARVLDALGATVHGVDPAGVPAPARPVVLDAGLAGCDAVTLHCSLTPSSRGLLSAARLDRLRPHAVVVNTARGGSLDVDAAVARVADGRLGGLGVDVFPDEPWPRMGAQAGARVLLTPHGAGYTDDLGERVARSVEAALEAWVAGGELPHRVA